MKNIHLIPTDKPSRLYLIKDKLKLSPLKFTNDEEVGWLTQHAYITSENEDINENDYIITKDGRLVQVSYLLSKDLDGASKVVIASDPDLIADGIQSIDDKFLEWFMKNPSCESVEVKKGFADGTAWGYNFLDYKIIIPEEEPKTGSMTECIKMIIDNQLNELEELKQKTLEETAERLYPKNIVDLGYGNSYDAGLIRRNDFIAGAKSDAARDYWFKIFKEQ